VLTCSPKKDDIWQIIFVKNEFLLEIGNLSPFDSVFPNSFSNDLIFEF
jgi:hypothetical protein